jgi:hypothetical protein
MILIEYPKELLISIMKLGRGNLPASDKIYHGTAVIPHVRVISEEFLLIGNRFNFRTIFRTIIKSVGH